jgi:hypothetical protein
MRNAYTILLEKSESKDNFGDQGLDGRTILSDIEEIEHEVLNWIHGPQGREQWRALVDEIMNVRVAQNVRNVLTN